MVQRVFHKKGISIAVRSTIQKMRGEGDCPPDYNRLTEINLFKPERENKKALFQLSDRLILSNVSEKNIFGRAEILILLRLLYMIPNFAEYATEFFTIQNIFSYFLQFLEGFLF